MRQYPSYSLGLAVIILTVGLGSAIISANVLFDRVESDAVGNHMSGVINLNGDANSVFLIHCPSNARVTENGGEVGVTCHP